MVSTRQIVLCLIALGFVVTVRCLEASPARPAPPLPPPTGAVVNVSTEPQLQAAVRSLTSNTTIVIAPGTYVLTSTLYLKAVTNVGIRGATSNSDDVVLAGPGMAQPNYGNVPFGIWTGDGVSGITIANLTIRDLFFHPIIFNAGTSNPRVYNVHLIDAGEQFIKSNPDDAGGGTDNGVVEYSVIEFTTRAKDDYTKGVDVHTAKNWVIRNNLFRNITAPPGQVAGPGVLVWRGTSNTIVEGNTFVNCDRGIMFGADDYYSPSHSGGIIRNNFFFRTASQPGDVGIILSDSPNTQVLNNTLYVSGTYGSPLEFRYPGTANVLIANNLVDGIIKSRDGGTATLTTNYEGAGPDMFVDAAAGDLHLSGNAIPAIDRGTPFATVVDDWDGQARPQGPGYDIGADERGGGAAVYRIAGRVTGATGAGIAGVTLTMSGGQSRTTTSDSAGAYSFTSLAAGASYTVTPSLAGYSFSPGSQFYASLTQDQLLADFTGTAMPAGGATAAFVGSDRTHGGTWIGTYGGDGYNIVGGPGSYPSYAQVAVASAETWIWSASTNDTRALQKPGGTDRAAGCWYSASSFTIDVNLTDGQPHQVALYSVDFDAWERALRVDVLDAASGAVLDTRSASDLYSGEYLVWSLSGHVVFRVVNASPANAVVSGIFFGAGVTPPETGDAAATFIRTDDATRGSWLGAYGTQGYALAADAFASPGWAQVKVVAPLMWIWSPSTTDERAMQRPNGASRLAACWYSPDSLTVDVNVIDGASHQVALYATDFDGWERTMRVDVLDAATGAILDSRTVADYGGGRYLVWSVKGHVTLQLTNTSPANAVLSGVLFD
jgi:hypothetical protein